MVLQRSEVISTVSTVSGAFRRGMNLSRISGCAVFIGARIWQQLLGPGLPLGSI